MIGSSEGMSIRNTFFRGKQKGFVGLKNYDTYIA